jgi:hypothetical protein
VDISAALAADLADLSHNLDDDVDLETRLHALTDGVKAAVPSYLGMTVTFVADGHDVSFTVREETEHVREITASLRIQLAGTRHGARDTQLVLYAAIPGAFVDLAVDVGYALTLDSATLILDGHLNPPDHESGFHGLAALSAINQAVGVLIGRGHTIESAHNALRRSAAWYGEDVAVTAAALLRTMRRSLELNPESAKADQLRLAVWETDGGTVLPFAADHGSA